jgi:HEPN domain-containing protein
VNKTPPQTKTIYVNGIIVGEVPATGDYESDLQAMLQFIKDKGLHRETTKVQAMFRQALSFATTAAHLHRTDLLKAPRNGLSVNPFVVNSAFAIELYLKTLHELQGTHPGKEHHLLKLYNDLTQATRDVVTKHALAEGKDYGAEVTTADQFREFVDELDNAFVDWRYCHESGRACKVTIQPTIVVMKAVHEACKELGAN